MNELIRYGADVVLLAVIVLETVVHAKKGFVRTMLTLLAVLLAFGISLKMAEPLASWSYDVFLDPTVRNKIEEHADEFAAAQTTKEVVAEVSLIIPDYLSEKLKKMDIDLSDVSDQIGSIDDDDGLTAQQISNRVVKPAAMILLKTICLILCYVVLMAVFRIPIHLLCKTAKLPVLHTADKTFGGLLGFLKGLLIVYLLALLCSLAAQLTETTEVKQVVEQSRIITVCRSIGSTEQE